MAAGSRRVRGTEPRIGARRTRVLAARTKVVLIVCALLVVPGYWLLYFEQPLHGRLKHRMCTAITLTSTHSTPHSRLTFGPNRRCPSHT